jgi:hypothetical protein
MKSMILVAVLQLFSFNLFAGSYESKLSRLMDPGILGPGDYYPWGKEIPFPWSSIQGVYHGVDKSGDTYYFFKVRTQNGNQRTLDIYQIDKSCRWITRGVGFEYNRVVRAVVTNQTGKSFEVTVQAFRVQDVSPAAKSNGIVTVLSKTTAGLPNSREIIPIRFLGPTSVCAKK